MLHKMIQFQFFVLFFIYLINYGLTLTCLDHKTKTSCEATDLVSCIAGCRWVADDKTVTLSTKKETLHTGPELTRSIPGTEATGVTTLDRSDGCRDLAKPESCSTGFGLCNGQKGPCYWSQTLLKCTCVEADRRKRAPGGVCMCGGVVGTSKPTPSTVDFVPAPPTPIPTVGTALTGFIDTTFKTKRGMMMFETTSSIKDKTTTNTSPKNEDLNSNMNENTKDINDVVNAPSESMNLLPIIFGAVGGCLLCLALVIIIWFVVSKKSSPTKQQSYTSKNVGNSSDIYESEGNHSYQIGNVNDFTDDCHSARASYQIGDVDAFRASGQPSTAGYVSGISQFQR